MSGGGEVVFIVQNKKNKMVATRHDLWAQNYPKCLCSRGSVLNPTGELTALPRPSSWICWATLRQGSEGNGKGEEREGGKGNERKAK